MDHWESSPELVKLKVKGTAFHKTALTSDTSLDQFRGGGPHSHLHFRLTPNLGVPMNSLRFDNLLEWFTELKKVLYLMITVLLWQMHTH